MGTSLISTPALVREEEVIFIQFWVLLTKFRLPNYCYHHLLITFIFIPFTGTFRWFRICATESNKTIKFKIYCTSYNKGFKNMVITWNISLFYVSHMKFVALIQLPINELDVNINCFPTWVAFVLQLYKVSGKKWMELIILIWFKYN